ncbi:unnamed protein product [Adineta steineri]|uniref:Uncharacterized protein n=3 Tax=Bdelloidea TaxID=44578 RepID=A0A819XA96_9BILA|nr:unnamed protein product [Rotaria sordida]CAF1520604.1 unnamed protein product [Adineta steineri]CAF1551119.1 unnamed protein product [Adineta ricciae]CAF1683951.1 unnamed protein product [Adineta ricciae]CAF4134365.1 unnamed protein product [Rotaria sordida]
MAANDDDEPFEGQFSIYYDEEEARKRAKKNDIKHMVFNRVSSVVIYYSHSRVSEYPLHHVGYLGRDLLFVVSTVCALLGNGPDKGDFIVRAAVSDVRHNRNHDQLGQFYVTIRQ